MVTLIFYACPTGPLAAQIEAYLNLSAEICDRNAAVAYMPHCTLMGFFQDELTQIPSYLETIEQTLFSYRSRGFDLAIAIEQLSFRANWHGLELQADWLKQFAADFANKAVSPTRAEPLRLKDWLHLSLAYDFEPECAPRLIEAARVIDISAPVAWELRFYQRDLDNCWQCHGRWLL